MMTFTSKCLPNRSHSFRILPHRYFTNMRYIVLSAAIISGNLTHTHKVVSVSLIMAPETENHPNDSFCCFPLVQLPVTTVQYGYWVRSLFFSYRPHRIFRFLFWRNVKIQAAELIFLIFSNQCLLRETSKCLWMDNNNSNNNNLYFIS